jgi:hypothetical protein
MTTRAPSEPSTLEGGVFSIRVDSTSAEGNRLYFFVNPEDSKWDPWWAALFSFLSGLRDPSSPWAYEPVQDVLLSRILLSREQRQELTARLQTAPSFEVQEHRSLSRTIKNLAGGPDPVQLIFFRRPIPRSR